MKILSITGLGSEIVATIHKNSTLVCSADEMRREIKYYNETGSKIPEMKERSLERALWACSEYIEEAYEHPAAKESDKKKAIDFLEKHEH